MEWTAEKWGGRPHYRGAVEIVGTDEHGSWLWGPAGRTIYRGDEALFVTDHPALALIVPDAWWSPTWFVDHADIDVYVNIGTPAVWESDQVVITDLDLDVIRFRDGRVEVVDRDEFDLHRAQYSYPAEIVEAAEAATERVFALVVDHVPPFDSAVPGAWMERAASAST